MRDTFHALDRLEEYLISWASWMRRAEEVRGYPRRAQLLETGGASKSFEDMCDDLDNRLAVATDAAIGDLPPAQQCAIHTAYLGAVYRFPRCNFEALLQDAKEGVAAGLRKRHIWMGE